MTSPILLKQEIGFTLPRIEIDSLGGRSTHLTIAKALVLFFTEILQTTLRTGNELIPEKLNQVLRVSLDSAIEDVGSIPEIGKEEITTIGKEVKEKGKDLKDNVKKSIKDVRGLFKKRKRQKEK